jgi:hypothetical protein
LTSLQAVPIIQDPNAPKENGAAGTGSGMGGEMETPSATGQPVTPQTTAQQELVEDRIIQPEFIFPTDGQYIVFVEFVPRGGRKVTLAVPVNAGVTETPPTALKANAPLTQSIGDLSVTLKFDGALKAGQDNAVSFKVTDAQGKDRSEDIGIMSGYRCILYVVDEKLTTFLRPELMDRNTLQFSVNFPEKGRYKVWFEFLYENQTQQVAFILDVK